MKRTASRVTDLVLAFLAAAAVVLFLSGAFLALGLHLDATSADAASPTDSGLRPVVITADPETTPAALLKESDR